MKTLKKTSLLFAALIALLSISAFTGCSDPNDELKEGKTSITFYARHFEDWSDEYTQFKVDEFNALEGNDVFIDLKIYEENTYNDALVIARENGRAPDLFMSSYSSLPQDVREQNVSALDDYFDDSVWEDLYPSASEFVTFNGQKFAFPWFTEPGTMFFYRKDVLANVGYNEAPKTFNELYDAASKIMASGDLAIGQYALGLPADAGDLAWVSWGLQYNLTGGLAVTEDWLTSRLDNPGYKELARFFYECAHKGYSNTSRITADGYSNLVEALFDGNLMMSWGGSWQIALLHTLAEEQGKEEMLEKIGVAPLPTLDGDHTKTTTANGGWCYTMSDTSSAEKKNAVAKFIQWLFVDNPENIGQYFVSACMSRQPASKKVSEYLDTVETGVDPNWIAAMRDVAALGKKEALYPWDISYAVANMLQECIMTKSPSFEGAYVTAYATAAKEIETIMSRESYTGNPWYSPEGVS